MTSCPVCDKPVDPLRSRFVGVRDGKIVAFCSAACAGERPDAAPAAARTELPATTVPTRTATPASGVPQQLAVPLPASGGPPRPGTPAPGMPISLDSGPVIEILHEPASGVVTSARDTRTELRARHPDEIQISQFWTADKEKSGARRSPGEPSAPVSRPSDPSSVDESSVPMVPGGRANSMFDSLFDIDEPPRRRRWPLVLVILVLLGAGGGLLFYFFGEYFGQQGSGAHGAAAPRPGAVPAATQAARAEAPRPVRPTQPHPAQLDPAAALDEARASLRGDLTATSPRVQRLAAAALARTQDRAACALLAAQIGPAPAASGDLARLDLAYALARAGDARGRNVLANALVAPRSELRDEAAGLLALLGDPRAVPHLVDLLAIDQRRLGAAEHLAHLAEPRALKVLDQVRANPRGLADDKARATVALGVAGRSDVAGALRGMLGDPHFNAFAAAALAELADRAAQPVLERQLASPPLRVLAARALRRLDPALDPRPLLPPLLDVIRAGRDVERIPAAEAILVLAGPSSWSAFD